MDPIDPSSLPPEVIAQILHAGTLDSENELLQEQMARAMALRHPVTPHTTGLGAALGGIGDIADTVNSYRQEKDINAKTHANLGQLEKSRGALYQQILRAQALRRPGALSGMSDGGFNGLAPPGELPPTPDTI